MATTIESTPRLVGPKRLNLFERYLTVWVAVCMWRAWQSEHGLPEQWARFGA